MKTEYFSFKGGLNLEAPALSLKKGELIGCMNYEPAVKGGYRRIEGYERVDGHPLASTGTYHIVDFNLGDHEPTAGDPLIGSISSAEGYYVTSVVESGSWAGSDAVGYIVVHVTSGEFETGDIITTGGTPVATATADQVARGVATDSLDSTYLASTHEMLRDLVEEVPGSGALRGEWYYNGTYYAFRDATDGLSCKMYKSTTSGWSEITTGVTLDPGGRYEFANHNFEGHAGSIMMFGVDGVNKGFQYDGTTFTQLTTAMTDDAPNHLYIHKMHLFFMFSGGSVQHSAIADPTSWSVVTGSGELALGDTESGFASSPGNALFMLCRNSTYVLKGSSASDWEFTNVSRTGGAIEWTIQEFNYPIYLDDKGVVSLRSVQEYGDFFAEEISHNIQRMIRSIKSTVTASVQVREKQQYRLFFEDKSILTFAFDGAKMIGVTLSQYDIVVHNAVSVEDENGGEYLLCSSDDGYLYRMDSGNNFDGEEVVAWLRPAFYHFGSPEQNKRFYKTVLEISAATSVNLTFLPMFEYDSLDLPFVTEETEATVLGGGNWWDAPDAYYEDFYYDAQTVGSAYAYTEGIGTTFSLFIRSTGTYEKPHTIEGMIIHYIKKGIKR